VDAVGWEARPSSHEDIHVREEREREIDTLPVRWRESGGWSPPPPPQIYVLRQGEEVGGGTGGYSTSPHSSMCGSFPASGHGSPIDRVFTD
jgi:hypothetical protein